MAESPYGFKAFILQIRGDWGEFAHSLGFGSWSTKYRPCLFCGASLDLLCTSLRDCNRGFCSHDLRTNDTYELECRACEVCVTIHNVADRNKLRAALYLDKRPKGSRGRALMWDVQMGDTKLLENDRLEPLGDLVDVMDFDTWEEFPLTLLFWRRPAEQSVRRRCVLFDVSLGIFLESP